MNRERMDCEDAQTVEIIQGLKSMPSLEAPPVLLDHVMHAVRNTRRPWTYRFYRWVTAPRQFTFTWLKAAPVAAALMLVGVFSSIHLFREDAVQVVHNGLPGGVPVTLSLEMKDAASVAVVGSFNDWSTEGYQMTRDADGSTWTLTVTLPQGRYEYAFVVDGRQIVADPHALLRQDDGFGTENAVLIVGNHHEKAI